MGGKRGTRGRSRQIRTNAALTKQPTCVTAYTTTSAAGSSPSTSCSGAAAADYAFTYVNGSVTVNKATATISVTLSSSSITTAQTLTVTVAVGGVSAANAPTGFVTLTSGSYSSSAVTLANGNATINIPAGSLAVGSDTLTVTYTPDGASSANYNGTSGTSSVSVTLAPTFVVSGGSTMISIARGATTGNTVPITVTPSNAFMGTVSRSCSISPVAASDPPACSISPGISDDQRHRGADIDIDDLNYGVDGWREPLEDAALALGRDLARAGAVDRCSTAAARLADDIGCTGALDCRWRGWMRR